MPRPSDLPSERRIPSRDGSLVLLSLIDRHKEVDLIMVELEQIPILSVNVQASVSQVCESLQQHLQGICIRVNYIAF
jgi:hypothetical protein